MRLIDRYLLRQLLGPTLLATLALTAVALLSQSLEQLEIIVERGQSLGVMLKLTLLALPQLISVILPIAVLVGALTARTDLAATLVREGEFTEPAPGLTVYAQSVDSRGRMGNLFIHVAESDGSATTYTADEGRMATRAGTPVLVMARGSTQEFSATGVLNYLTFDEYIFDLGPLVTSDAGHGDSIAVNGVCHARLATPLYNIAFMALALAAILGGGYDRMGYGRRIAWAGAAAALTRILGFVVQAASESAAWVNLLQYVVPLATIAVALQVVFRQRVSRFIDMRKRPVRIARAGAAA
ncbi:MAG: hypothetical protein B7Z13_11045 [Caulobacterales bacterium 32-67-6]|nr:MAG: hypothetical protein B7Z13_11045 [Caulobacterales bacterium 32-67-6]